MPSFIHPRSWLLSGLCLVGLWPSLPTTSAQVLASSRTAQQRTPTPTQPVLLREALLLLMQERKVEILFDERLLGTRRTAAVRRPNATVSTILTNLLAGSGLTFNRLRTNTYLIVEETARPASPSSDAPAAPGTNFGTSIPGTDWPRSTQPGTTFPTERPLALDRTLTGRVVSETNEGLPGVSVVLKGTSRGTTTNADGRFQLSIPDGQSATLVFSYVGYVTQEIVVGNQSVVDLKLATDAQALGEVVVVGYGTVRKTDLTGSVVGVENRTIKELPVASFGEAIQGRLAGVQISASSAAPGAGISIRVRGGNSINAGNEPLYVIDGIPIYSNNASFMPNAALGTGGGTIQASLEPPANPLASLNPSDIESIQVLKDASATAIYGSRGANGVVIIQTKRGREGRSNVTYETYVSFQEVSKKLPVMNSREFLSYYKDLQDNRIFRRIATPGQDRVLTPAQMEQLALVDTDWQDEIFRPATMMNHQIAINGGTAKTRYNVGLNYFNQPGVVLSVGFERYQGRVNLDLEVSKRLKVGTSFNYSFTKRDNGLLNGEGNPESTDLIYSALALPPIIPVRRENGDYWISGLDFGNSILAGPNNLLGLTPAFNDYTNPVYMAEVVKNTTRSNRVLGSFFADYQLLPGLTFRSNIGVDVSDAKQTAFLPASTRPGTPLNGRGSVSDVRNLNWVWSNTLTYDRTFSETNRLNVVLGTEIQRNINERLNVSTTDFFSEAFEYVTLQAGANTTNTTPSSNYTDWSLASFFGRANYSFRNRYLFTATVRADGSSRFGSGNKYGFFPSGAVAWRISEEPFLKGNSTLSDLKLRFSYGLTGNTEIGSYQSLTRLGTNSYVFGQATSARVIGAVPGVIGDPNLRWEQTAQTDIGLDIGLFRDRLSLTIDAYYKKTSDLLLNLSLPVYSGFGSVLTNVGSIENKGLEFSLTSENIRRNSFTWSTSANISFNRNKVLDIGENQEIAVGRGFQSLITSQPSSILRVGLPVGVFYGAIHDGIWDIGEAPAYNNDPSVARPTLAPAALAGDIRYKDTNGDGVFNSATDRIIVGDPNPDFTFGLTNSFRYRAFDLNVFMQGSYGNDILNYTKVRFLYTRLAPADNRFSEVATGAWKNYGDFRRDSDDLPISGQNISVPVMDRLIEDGSYLRIRNVALGYTLPAGTLKWLQAARIYASVQNLVTFTRYSGYDPEVNFGGQDNFTRGIDVLSYPATRTVTLGLNLTF